MTVSLTAVIRGFRVPVAILDRFLVANGLTETDGYAPFYHGDLNDASKLLRAKLGGSSSSSSSSDDNKTRLFIPYRTSRHHSPFAYVAYDWLFVHAQRKLHLPEELPNTVPASFAALRDEIMGFAGGAEAQASTGPGDDDEDLAGLFVIITDEQSFGFKEPFVQKAGTGCGS